MTSSFRHGFYSIIVGVSFYFCYNSSDYCMAQKNKRDEIVLLLSGKRFAGKDFICNKIESKLYKNNISYKRFNHADQMKRIYCESTGANLELMLKDRKYKEQHRNELTRMYQGLVSNYQNRFRFCQSIYNQILNLEQERNEKYDVILIADFRRKYEEEFYHKHFEKDRVFSIRINPSNQTRMSRGWMFNDRKDNDVTECELDDKRDWDFVFKNEGTAMDATQWIDNQLLPEIKSKLIK